MMQQNIQAALFEFTTVDEVVSKYQAMELLPACSYTTPAIPMFDEVCTNPAVNEPHTLEHPAIYMAEVKDYKMIGGCAFPIVDNKCVKPQMFDVNTWETWEQAKGVCLTQGNQIAYRNIIGHVKYQEKAINLCTHGYFDFGHWLIDCLPKLVLLMLNDVDLTQYKVLINQSAPNQIINLLKLFGINNQQIVPIKELCLYEFESVLWVSPISNFSWQLKTPLKHPSYQYVTHATAIKRTHEYIQQKLNKHQQINRLSKVYLRAIPHQGQLENIYANQIDLDFVIDACGFKALDLAVTKIDDQILSVSNAKELISNLNITLGIFLFLNTNAKVYLMSFNLINKYFEINYQIATILGLQTNVIQSNYKDLSYMQPDTQKLNVDDLKIIINQTDDCAEKIKLSINQYAELNSYRFAFLVHEPVLLSHYKEIWHTLCAKSFVIVLTDSFFTNKEGKAKQSVKDFIDYVELHQFKTASIQQVLEWGIKFPYVISNHCIEKYKNVFLPLLIGHKQIRHMYGADVGDGWSLQKWNEMYDIFLCHGDNDQSAINSRFKGKTYIMGYPRYDRYFEPNLDITCVQNEFEIDSGKKTILWMPTLGGDYSSIPLFADKFKDLVDQYNFIVRPHPISFVQEPDFIQTLERCNYKIDRNAIRDMNALYKIADVVLADNGGSPFSAIFMGKNVIFLEVPEDLGANQNSFHIVNTSVYELKKELPVIKQDNPEQLAELLNSPNFQKENSLIIEKLFKKYFNCPRGGGAQRVVDILNSLE